MDAYRASTYSGLVGNNTASGNNAAQSQVGEQLVLVGVVGVAADVVGIQAEVMSQTVGEEGSAGASSKDLVLVALEDTKTQQAVNGNLVSENVSVVPVDASLEDGGGVFLHLQDNVVDVARLCGEFAREGECTGLKELALSTDDFKKAADARYRKRSSSTRLQRQQGR